MSPAAYDDELGSLQLADVRAYYAQPGHDPTTLVRDLLSRIRAQSAANAWIALADDDVLLAAAADLTRRWPSAADRPPLWGIPIAVKDNVDVRGLPTTAGCPDYAYEPLESASLVRHLVAAGALIVGKTNMDQFASGLTGARSAYGIVRSPFDLDYIGGGSSSGSAAAVALGLASAAIGTDTAGSGRVPAALTNTVGLKPSRGLVSSRGIVPACRSLDCPSVFALSVGDAAAVLAVIAGVDPDDPWSQALPVPPAAPGGFPVAPRIGVVDLDLEPVDDAVRVSYADALETLAALGATLVPVELAPFVRAGELLYDGPWVAERLTELESWIDSHPSSLLPVTATVLGNARAKSAVDAFRGFHELRALTSALAPVWDSADAIVLPTVAVVATVADTLADPHATNTRMGRYTNVGQPARSRRCLGTDRVRPGRLGHRRQPLRPGRVGRAAGGTRGRPAQRAGPAGRRDRIPGTAVLGSAARRRRAGDPGRGGGASRRATAERPAARAGCPSDRHRYDGRDLPVVRAADLSGRSGAPAGMVRVAGDGASIEVELYRLPVAGLGRLLTMIPAPLGLGLIDLLDGARAIGFVCEAAAVDGALDISEFKSWLNYLADPS